MNEPRTILHRSLLGSVTYVIRECLKGTFKSYTIKCFFLRFNRDSTNKGSKFLVDSY